jgi:phytanoyl-CoA dioxygenase PhyH
MTGLLRLASSEAAATRAVPDDEIRPLKLDYKQLGFAVIRGVVSPERLSLLHKQIIDEFESKKAAGTLFNGGGLFTGHLNCFPGEESRFVYQTLQDRGVIDLIREIFPKALRHPNVGLNLNLPGSIAQHYHCDRPYVQEFMICNIAVVDTVIENGAIDLLPGTHKKFYPFWRFALERPSRRTTRIEMKQGDVLLRSSNLWHRGMPNLSKHPRPMMALTWEDGGSVLDDPFTMEKGKITFRANWFRPNVLGRLRERTFAAAPISYDAFRFVRSFFGRKGYDN